MRPGRKIEEISRGKGKGERGKGMLIRCTDLMT